MTELPVRIRIVHALFFIVCVALSRPAPGAEPHVASPAEGVTLDSLLAEMTDRDRLARFPQPEYQCLQVSSYNRQSVRRDAPGWFADSDGIGFIRQETVNGQTEWVLMEHEGPGCITKIWTPFFYYRLNDHVGPQVRIYLDGRHVPAIEESLIKLVTAQGFIPPPLAAFTARAGNAYLPIPFAQSCKITMTGKPFYYIINYRAYPQGTAVETFTMADYAKRNPQLVRTAHVLYKAAAAGGPAEGRATEMRRELQPGEGMRTPLPPGPSAVYELSLQLDRAEPNTCLRSTVLALSFDQEQTVWCPVGDFFCCADSLHAFHTWERTVSPDGKMTCRWIMPYKKTATVEIQNEAGHPVALTLRVATKSWDWDPRSMYFHANWRPDEVVPGRPFQDWNFIDIRGKGVYVGDAWTVLNIEDGWWGEGDEKIYVDNAWDRGFPTHFGTGTEDYYGWAGGVVPTRADEFDEPFVANVRVGGLGKAGRTRGYNICTRTRSLDAIPFGRHLHFDMEASFGTQMRMPWDLLGYSAVTFWYAGPGARCNRGPQPKEAAHPILSLSQIQRRSASLAQRLEHTK